MATKKRFVVVTTEHRGVFGGYMGTQPDDPKTVVLTDAMMCLSWSADVKGVLGLAVTGPSKQSRVGPAVPKLTVLDVTAVMDATDVAEKAWLARPW